MRHFLTIPLLLLLPLGLGSCDKVMEVVKKTAASAKKEAPAKTEATATPARQSPAAPLLAQLENKMASTHAPAPLPLVTNLSDEEYEGFVAQRGALLVVDYHAGWCGPCKQLAPVLEQVASEFDGKVSIGKVDVDTHAALARKANVTSIPDVRLFRDGKQVGRFVGIESAGRIRSMFQAQTSDLKTTGKQEVVSQGPGPAPAAAPAAKGSAGSMERMGKDWLPPGMQRR